MTSDTGVRVVVTFWLISSWYDYTSGQSIRAAHIILDLFGFSLVDIWIIIFRSCLDGMTDTTIHTMIHTNHLSRELFLFSFIVWRIRDVWEQTARTCWDCCECINTQKCRSTEASMTNCMKTTRALKFSKLMTSSFRINTSLLRAVSHLCCTVKQLQLPLNTRPLILATNWISSNLAQFVTVD